MSTTPTPRRPPARLEGAVLQDMARLVTQTTLTCAKISRRLGIAPSTVRRHIVKEGWSRPETDDVSALAAIRDPELRRRGFAERMWRIAEYRLGKLEREQLEADKDGRSQGLVAREMIGLVQAVDKLSSLVDGGNPRSRKSKADTSDEGHGYDGIQPVQGISPHRFVFRMTTAPAREPDLLADHLEQTLQDILSEQGDTAAVPDADVQALTLTTMRDLAGIADIWQARQAASGD